MPMQIRKHFIGRAVVGLKIDVCVYHPNQPQKFSPPSTALPAEYTLTLSNHDQFQVEIRTFEGDIKDQISSLGQRYFLTY